jgi:hypothetical protein
MKYSTPELVVVGTAASLVLGGEIGELDNPVPETEPAPLLALGLDE